MNNIAIALALFIVVMAVRPSVVRGARSVRNMRLNIAELQRRKVTLSQQIRALARRSRGQRETTKSDHQEVTEIKMRLAGLTRKVAELERIDRRILVVDERRGLQETGWILMVRRSGSVPLEPERIKELWDKGRYLFVFATDVKRARRKIEMRYLPEDGYEIIDVFAHEGELADPPTFGGAAAQQAAASN